MSHEARVRQLIASVRSDDPDTTSIALGMFYPVRERDVVDLMDALARNTRVARFLVAFETVPPSVVSSLSPRLEGYFRRICSHASVRDVQILGLNRLPNDAVDRIFRGIGKALADNDNNNNNNNHPGAMERLTIVDCPYFPSTHLADGLGANTRLKYLKLLHANLGQPDSGAIFAAVRDNPHSGLTHLDLSDNRIGLRCMKALSALIVEDHQRKCNLRNLNICSHRLGGIAYFIKALKRNASLKTLCLPYISMHHISYISDIFDSKINTTLRHISIGGQDYSDYYLLENRSIRHTYRRLGKWIDRGMHPGCVPLALASEINQSSDMLFTLLKNNPSWFNLEGIAATSGTRKRPRELSSGAKTSRPR